MKIKSIEIVDESKLSNFGRITAAMLDQHARAGKLWITREGSTYYLHIGDRKVYLYGYYNDFYSSGAAWAAKNFYTWSFADYINGITDNPVAGWEHEIAIRVFDTVPTSAAGRILAALARKCREDFEESEDEVDIENFDVVKK